MSAPLVGADGCASSGNSDGTGGATGGSSTGGSPTGGSSTGGSSTGGTQSDGASGTGGTLGWFPCGSCLCDGSKEYCSHITSGAGAGGMGAVDSGLGEPDAACPVNGGCAPLPSACGDTPSCECLPLGANCKCTFVEAGFYVECAGGSGGV